MGCRIFCWVGFFAGLDFLPVHLWFFLGLLGAQKYWFKTAVFPDTPAAAVSRRPHFGF